MHNLIGFGSLPLNGGKQASKEKLVKSLLNRHLTTGLASTPDFSLSSDKRGRPVFYSGEIENCFISYSYCEDKLWTALSAGYTIGIDVETPLSFNNNYPYEKVFSRKENRLRDMIDPDPNSSAAALWSCKEAVVKARGTGFSDIGPAEVEITTIQRTSLGFTIEVLADTPYTAILQREAHLWRAFACASHHVS